MATIQKDGLFQGTTLTRGAFSSRFDSAVRVIRVTELTDALTAPQTAISACYAYAPGNFPGTTIPLKSMQFVPSSGTTGRVYMRYYRILPSTPPSTVAKFRFGMREIRWYDTPASFSGGAPSGSLGNDYMNNVAAEPPCRPISVAVMQMYVPWVLDYNPVEYIGPLQNTMNSDNVTFGGISFDANTLHFMGAEVDWQDTNVGPKYVGSYTFEFREDGWWEQRPERSGNSWQIMTEKMYPQTTFAGAFPYT